MTIHRQNHHLIIQALDAPDHWDNVNQYDNDAWGKAIAYRDLYEYHRTTPAVTYRLVHKYEVIETMQTVEGEP